MEPYKPNFNTEFYEDEGDHLKDFRKIHKGAAYDKNGKDPFENDPDVLQAKRQEKLMGDTQNMNYYNY